MPREKKFDIDDAIDRATEVFWAKGYEATSLADLLDAIGIKKGSFYNAFGSKKQLFTKSLLKYDQEQRRKILVNLSSLNSPVDAISNLFDGLIAQSLADDKKKGCLLVNTALDLPNHDADTEVIVQQSMAELETFFVDQIKLGIQQGSINSSLNVETSAKGLLTLVTGLRVLARGVFDEKGLKSIKSQALNLIF